VSFPTQTVSLSAIKLGHFVCALGGEVNPVSEVRRAIQDIGGLYQRQMRSPAPLAGLPRSYGVRRLTSRHRQVRLEAPPRHQHVTFFGFDTLTEECGMCDKDRTHVCSCKPSRTARKSERNSST